MQQEAFVEELEAHALECAKSPNGTHVRDSFAVFAATSPASQVIQKLLERVSPDRLRFVATFHGHLYQLSTHVYGCQVLRQCLEHLSVSQTRPLLDELHTHTDALMRHHYGVSALLSAARLFLSDMLHKNYVVQLVLKHGEPEDRVRVVSTLRGQVLQMAKDKFASNVCETALAEADTESRRQLIEEMLTTKQDGDDPIASLMKDQYASE